MQPTKFDEFLEYIKDLKKNYQANKEVKLSATSLFDLIMTGGMDHLMGTHVLTLGMRKEKVAMLKKALKSTAAYSTLDTMETELDRKFWLSEKLPSSDFTLVEEYTNALRELGFRRVSSDKKLRFTNDKVDLFTNYDALFMDIVLEHYGSKYQTRTPGLIAKYVGYNRKKWNKNGRSGEFLKLIFTDGREEFETTVWQTGKGNYPKWSEAFINDKETHTIFLITGRISKGYGKYKNFNLRYLKGLS